MRRIAEYRLRARKWTTVATNFSGPERIYLEIWSPTRIKWRRIGLIPGFGSFRKRTALWSGFGIVQIKMYENRTCKVTHGGSPPPGFYDDDAPTPPEEKAQFAMRNLPQ